VVPGRPPAYDGPMRIPFAAALAAALLPGCASAWVRAEEAFAREEWGRAALHYEEALREGGAPDPAAGRERLGEARTRASAAHLAEAALREARGDAAGAWAEAREALGHAPDAVAADRARAAAERAAGGLLGSADAAADGGREDEAAAIYARALSLGVDAGLVARRRDARIAADWVVTVHGAVILPFTPVDREPWDGPPDATVPSAAAAGLLGDLARLADMEIFSLARAATVVVAWARSSIEPPDTYPRVLVGDRAFGGAELADDDDFQPVWNLRIPVHATTRDGRPFSVDVRDEDLADDDNVGSWATTLGAILAGPAVQDLPLVGPDGVPRAGGIAALRILVERR
jgi:tetratricopeptide (TPR) repeat protein